MECLDEYSKIAPEYDNPDTREFVRLTIIEALEKTGLTYQEDNPDLLVDFKIVIEEKMAIVGSPETAYYYWETYNPPTVKFNHGTLIVNLIEAGTNKAVWQGIASRTLQGEVDQDRATKTIHQMIKKLRLQ